MVTFNCEVCNATVPKKGTEKHYFRCPNAYYTCIDCSTTFDDGYSYQKHTECISEDEKYQKGLYKGKKKSVPNTTAKVTKPAPKPKETKVKETKPKETKVKETKVKYFKDGESLYNCLKSIKDKDEKKKLLKSIILKQQPDNKDSFQFSL